MFIASRRVMKGMHGVDFSPHVMMFATFQAEYQMEKDSFAFGSLYASWHEIPLYRYPRNLKCDCKKGLFYIMIFWNKISVLKPSYYSIPSYYSMSIFRIGPLT